ncbi:hypothetical protein [Synechococcus sp. CCY 9618]|uniref:hypothetical protein n=1 Tax=Synechococcus sp. CCY 9618 TaxID=2815602 RepID=UPI001C21DD71|nr:hypothetical protein [Synechococcus sp. CCY 9618]
MAPASASGEIIVYEAPDGSAQVDVRLDQHTVWQNQKQIADLSGRECSVMSKHILNVFQEGELDPQATVAKFAQVRSDLRCASKAFERFGVRLSTIALTAVDHSLASAEPNNDPDDLPFVGMAESLFREPGQFLNQAFHGSHLWNPLLDLFRA